MFFILHCDAIRSEQFQNLHFSLAYNLWPTRLYKSKQIITFARHEYGRVGVFRIKISCSLSKSVNFQTVPIWLHHTACTWLLSPMNDATSWERTMCWLQDSESYSTRAVDPKLLRSLGSGPNRVLNGEMIKF